MTRFERAVRWCRAVDIPTTKPPFFKYKPPSRIPQYEPFSARDSERLEQAHLAQSRSPVRVEADGLLCVDLQRQLCFPTYWDGPGYSVRRVQWFEGSQPVDPVLAEALESHSDRFDNYKITYKEDEVVLSPCTWMRASRRLTRNPKFEKTRPEYVERPISHLVLCIHGIGQTAGTRYEFVNFVSDVDKLRSLMGEAFKRSPQMRQWADSTTNHEVQVLPIQWRHLLPDIADKIRPLYSRDNVLAEVVWDFVMYTEGKHKKRILETTAAEINRVYRNFCRQNPGFASRPRISIVGHSLGACLAAEILHNKLVDLKASNLFLLGSPLGALLLLNGSNFSESDQVRNVFNIMRLSDPVAARLEPVVENAPNPPLPPQILPSAGASIISQIKDISDRLSGITSHASAIWDQVARLMVYQGVTRPKVQAAAACQPTDAFKVFNSHQRIDFSVPEAVDISPLIGLIGHVMYMDNADVAQFLLREILRPR